MVQRFYLRHGSKTNNTQSASKTGTNKRSRVFAFISPFTNRAMLSVYADSDHKKVPFVVGNYRPCSFTSTSKTGKDTIHFDSSSSLFPTWSEPHLQMFTNTSNSESSHLTQWEGNLNCWRLASCPNFARGDRSAFSCLVFLTSTLVHLPHSCYSCLIVEFERCFVQTTAVDHYWDHQFQTKERWQGSLCEVHN